MTNLAWSDGVEAREAVPPLPLAARDYLYAALPLLLLTALFCFILTGATVEQRAEQRREKERAEAFWNRIAFQSPLPGRNENGDCFLFAINLRNLIQEETGEQARFVFVRWLDLDPAQGPTLHVYTQFEALHQVWVVDNMGHADRCPLGTTPAVWMRTLAPKGHPYQIIGDTHDMVQYVSKM